MTDKTLNDRRVLSLKTDRGQEIFFDAKLPGFGVRVSGRTGSKTFIARYRVGQKRTTTVIGPFPLLTVAEARQRARDVIQKAKMGIDVVAIADAEETLGTVGAFWPAFMEAKTLRPRTAIHYEALFANHVAPKWASRSMAEIRRNDVAELLAPHSSKPVLYNHIRRLVSNLFNTAGQLGFAGIEHNPATMVAVGKEQSRDRSFKPAELLQLWKGFESASLLVGGVFKMVTLTAQRQEQVRRMRWEDIEGPTWKCPAKFAKGNRDTWIPLSEAALAVLDTMRGLNDVWVFPAKNAGGKLPHVGPLSGEFRKLADAEEIEDARCHDLRTTFNTIATAPVEGDVALTKGLGISPTVAAACLSHKPEGSALAYDRYTSAEGRAAYMIAERREALDAWAAYIRRANSSLAIVA